MKIKHLLLVIVFTTFSTSATYESIARAQLAQESALLKYQAHQRIFVIFATKGTKYQYLYNMKKSKKLKDLKGLYTFGD